MLFNCWTEYHARAIGHYFLRKYSLKNFKAKCHLEHLINYEFPYQFNYMVDTISKTDELYGKLYTLSHFFGRYAVWQHLYPEYFNDDLMNQICVNNPWMKELYSFYIGNNTVQTFHNNISTMEQILEKI